MDFRRWLVMLLGVVALGPNGLAIEAVTKPQSSAPVDFASQIQPILSKKCYPCHGPDDASRKAKLRLDSLAEAARPRKGRPALAPGDLGQSELVHRINTSDPEELMPPPETKNVLTRAEIDLLQRWVLQGADYSQHWAWQAPQRPALPPVVRPGWDRNGIDLFVASKLAENGLQPNAEADRHTLVRRLSLDLTGLPPTPADVAAFVNDSSSDAYERVVDRLLASPHFGERWARVWLDLGRYADSAGYGSDPLRPNIWPWRDWLVRALNANQPYDQFTRDLLGGDLVPDATEDQKVATGFHRNTMTNTEGGTDDEEWRVAAVKDRAGVTAQVWMGLTMNCAQCHTHKFDPITQKEYYSFYAFFNGTEDNDQPDERPTLPVYSAQERRERAALATEITKLEEQYRAPNPEFDRELQEWSAGASAAIDWRSLEIGSAVSSSTNTLIWSSPSPGTVLVAGNSPQRESYVVTGTVPLSRITALQVEALPDPSLPKTGPGRAANGAFVLNEVRLEVLPSDAKSTKAKFVRVEAPGSNRILSLAEVQVFSSGTNWATRGTARQSSTDYSGDPQRAIDGNTDGNFDTAHSTTHTKTEADPWWEVDLGQDVPVEQVAIWNRTDGSVGSRLADVKILFLDAERKSVWEQRMEKAPAPVAYAGPSSPRVLKLAQASADFSQRDFPAAAAVDGDAGKSSGWAVGGELGQAHRWAAELAEPLEVSEAIRLQVSLVQNYGEQHTLGKFRLSFTDHASPVRIFPKNVEAALAVKQSERSPEQRETLESFLRPQSRTLGPLYREIAATKAKREAIRGTPVPVMRELELASARVTKVLNKGNFLDPGEPVTPGVPAAFHAWPTNAPRTRLGLAAWLTAPDNPLTARVAVNRFWGQLMGQPLVETEEDFGTQGSLPTNRPLLDWLAVSFQTPKVSGGAVDPWSPQLGWDFKAFVKLVVTSAAYRQSSSVSPEVREKDPLNRLYSRGARRRLEAETVRDQALSLSGLLSHKFGGPSVYPAQPDGLWRAAFNGERSWATSEGEDRYRRGIYTFWRRTIPYPSMATFDAPSRETCTLRRQPTNTPLQAFVTLNDPVFFECAQALGRRMAQQPGETADRVRFGLELVLARPAQPVQVAVLTRLFDSERRVYEDRPEEARRLAAEPLGPLPVGLAAPEAAAWTEVANVLLNLDGVLTKN